MTALAIHFPWRRYHATPWGNYVNEGAVEVPPSPWRLLRSLYSTWRMRRPELDADTVHGMLRALAAPPSYLMPPYRIAHTRHYYPDSDRKSGTSGNTDKAIDAFAALGADATMYVLWPGELDDKQAGVLSALAASLPYLGRADSLCDARVLGAPPTALSAHRAATPLDLDDEPPRGRRRAGVLAADLPLDLDALTARPVDVRARKLRYPPGARLLPYAIPEPMPAERGSARRARPPAEPVVAVRLALSAPAVPPVTQTVTLADALRSACVKGLDYHSDPRASLLAGKDADRRKLTGHRHAHFLPLDTDGDRRIDEIVVWTPGGLDPRELAALSHLPGIGTPEQVRGPKNVRVRVGAYGAVDILPPWLRGPSRVWISRTPFVPNRHRKKNQDASAFLIDTVTRELGFRDLPAPRDIRPVDGDWMRFTRHRWTGRHGVAEARPGHGLRLEFAEPVSGPIVLGALSHFGLGRFEAVDEP